MACPLGIDCTRAFGRALRFKSSLSEQILGKDVADKAHTSSDEGKWVEAKLKTVYTLDPLSDPRWAEFVAGHARGGIFHAPGWLESLRRTYDYVPVAYTMSPPTDPLRSALLFCRVDSWLTGHRLVSVPFADHCEPLTNCPEDSQVLLGAVELRRRKERWRYIEVRTLYPLDAPAGLFRSSYHYCFHQLSLQQDIGTLFHNFHKDSVQRKIRRAERENLIYEEGRSATLLDAFYALYLRSRRRQRIPPQPLRWFQNLIDCLGETLKIRVAFKDAQPTAAIITLFYKDILSYKYGCSNKRFNNLGGVHLLLWTSIQEAKREGLRTLDFGRSGYEQTGLITFKDRWGASRSDLAYSRYTASAPPFADRRTSGPDWKLRYRQNACSPTRHTAASALWATCFTNMSAKSSTTEHVGIERALVEYFRCPEDLARFETRTALSETPGFFKFGHDAIGYGRHAGTSPSPYVTNGLFDVSHAVRIENERLRLPFNFSEVVDNLRHERYGITSQRAFAKLTGGASRKIYYFLRPMFPVPVRKLLQKARLRGWDRITFPRWPVDFTVETLMQNAMALVLKAGEGVKVPFIWFWPDGAPSCVIMTHDVETTAGRDACGLLMDMDDSFGIKSAFQIVPEVRYEVCEEFLENFRRRGFEVNVHDLNHDGSLLEKDKNS